MRIRAIAIILFFSVSFLSRNKNTTCTEEQIVQKQKAFKQAYHNWKEALNYMDEDVINTSKILLDSNYLELIPCIQIQSNLIAEVDSISLIFANYNVKRLQIEKGERKIEALDKLVISITSDKE